MTNKKETIIISLGGSLVAPDEIDLGFLKNFKLCLQKYLDKYKFFILVGGGRVTRVYQKALLEFGAKPVDRDWIGISVTRLNAEVVKNVFNNYAYPKIITDPNQKVKTNKDIVVGAGWKPGWSTDYVAVLLAKTYGIGSLVNLSNIDYVYDKNPKEFPDAKPLKEADWKTLETIVGSEWIPGLSMPFDPRAAKLAKRMKIKVAVINGSHLDRLEDFLNGKEFIGTTIQ